MLTLEKTPELLQPPPKRPEQTVAATLPEKSTTLLLLDGMALMHPFAHGLGSMSDSGVNKMIHNWVAMMQRPFLFGPVLTPTPYIVPVLLWDIKDPTTKQYWRHSIHRKYKGGRKAKSSLLSYIAQGVEKLWTEAGMLSYGMAGFEADDWAGYIVKTRPSDSRVLLATSDSDWGQLISGSVHWLDTYPRAEIRAKGHLDPSQGLMILGEYEFVTKVNNHRTMGGYPISKPRDLVDNKWYLGDLADKIPGGRVVGLRGIIDLLEPTIEIPNPPDVWGDARVWLQKHTTPLYLKPDVAPYTLSLPEFNTGAINYYSGKVRQPYE